VRAEHAVSLVKETRLLSCVGDWVVLELPEGHDNALIDAVLPRRNAFVRKDPAKRTGQQTLAANIDRVLVMQALSGAPLSQRALERQMVAAYDSGAQVTVVLTKGDAARQFEEDVATARRAAPAAEALVVSSLTGEGLDAVRELIPAGTTCVLLGRSGVGKSTLVNALTGTDAQRTADVRARDDKGRHTTVSRCMLAIPGGGLLVDIPGVRALALWDSMNGLDAAFPEVSAAAGNCRFRDCTHGAEPGCAVRAAVERGSIDANRLQAYLDMRLEMQQTAERIELRERAARRGR